MFPFICSPAIYSPAIYSPDIYSPAILLATRPLLIDLENLCMRKSTIQDPVVSPDQEKKRARNNL